MLSIENNMVFFLDQNTIEHSAMQQIRNVASLPFIHEHVAVMADCHAGIGATVGSVIPTRGAVIPAAVGVDIGCGVCAVLTQFRASDLPDNLSDLRLAIEKAIPLGAGAKHQDLKGVASREYKKLLQSPFYKNDRDYTHFKKDWHLQLGTLGSGNHFIEVCLDEAQNVWVMLHSGSRGIGNVLASHHIRIAQALMNLWHIKLPHPDLAYLAEHSKEFDDYISDLKWLQDYALSNREIMMDLILSRMAEFMKTPVVQKNLVINCHHNFTQKEHHFGQNVWVTRKGAIQMRNGQLGIIPGSMGNKSYVVSGRGNALSFNSAPHGAGRRFSRKKARESFTLDDFDRDMAGIECRRDEALLDELPGAYKDIDTVMENSVDLVKVEYVLKQILNVKGN